MGLGQETVVERDNGDTETIRFPLERIRVASIQAGYTFTQDDALAWAIGSGLVKPGDVEVAEASPTLLCPEACSLCPDSSVKRREDIALGLVPETEARATPEIFKQQLELFYQMGVRHFMFIGGTVDHLPELPDLVEYTLALGKDVRVSWFTDMIAQIDEQTANASVMLQANLEHGWIQKVATHVSLDHPFEGDLFVDKPDLPMKRGRVKKFKEDAEYSRRFKSEYGVVGARRLVEAGVPRVVLNTTITPQNSEEIEAIYEQVWELQEYAEKIGSHTEVLWTFSPIIWRPHQARGDLVKDSPASGGLQYEQMPQINRAFGAILEDTYMRIASERPRILANSSGYTYMMADPRYWDVVVNQELAYEGGKPEIFNINPEGDIWIDSMFPGPELIHIHSIFGYRDRVYQKARNAFVRFQDSGREWFPNIVSRMRKEAI